MSDCPSPQELGGFDLGRLSPERMEWVAAHLDTCADCAELLEQLESSDDELLGQLRRPIPHDVIGDDELDSLIDRVLEAESSSAEATGADLDATHEAQSGQANVQNFEGITDSFGDYEILEEISRGGMGVVYKAHQISLNRIVAIKMILAGHLADDSQVRRFRTEAEAAASLDHPGIVPVYEVGERDGRAFFSMGYVNGPSLAERLKEGPLPPRDASALLQKIALAVQYAHDCGVIHRDLKPSNVLLSSVTSIKVGSSSGSGQAAKPKDTSPGSSESRQDDSSSDSNHPSTDDLVPRITDFGLAKLLQTESDLTVSGQVMGTPSYMPPEQARGHQDEIGPCSDIYSLGAVLYHTLTGRPPFQADNPVETLRQVVDQEPVSPRQLNSEIPIDLDTICLKCLAKAPSKRYASAEQLADDLKRFRNSEPIHARPTSPLGRSWRWSKRNPVVAGLTLLAAMLLLSGAGISTYYAVQARTEATNARGERIRANREAEAARALAARETAARERVEQLVVQEKQARKKAEVVAYSFQIHAARHEVRQGRLTAAKAILDGCDTDLAGWEHQFVLRQATRLKRDLHENQEAVYEVAFSPNGTYVASMAERGTIRVWDAKTWIELHVLKGTRSGLVFHPNGNLLMGANLETITLWDVRTGAEVRSIQAPSPVTQVAFSSDGERIVSGGSEADASVRIWDTHSGNLIRTLTGHEAAIRSVAFGPNGKRVVSAGKKGLRVWNAYTGALQFRSGGANTVVFSPDGKRIAAGRQSGEIAVFDAENGSQLLSIKEHREAVYGITYSPAGDRISSASWDDTVRVWDANTGREILILEGHQGFVESVAFSPDGKRLVSGGRDKTVKVWDVNTNESRVFTDSTERINSVAWFPDSGQVVTGGLDGKIHVYDAMSGDERSVFQGHSGRVMCVAVSPDGKDIFSCGDDRVVRVWNSESQVQRLTLKGHTNSVLQIAVSPDGKRIASGSYDKTVRIWDSASGRILLVLEGHPADVRCVAWSPDGKRIASGSWDGTVKVWDAITGEEVFAFVHMRDLSCVAFDPDSKRLVCAAAHLSTGVVKVWDLGTRQAVLTIPGWFGSCTSAHFTPDGSQIVGACQYGHLIRVWDAKTGRVVATYPGFTWVPNCALSPDGKRIAGFGGKAGLYGELRLLERKTGKPLILQEHMTRVESVAFSPDGELLVSGERKGKITVWNVRTGRKARTLRSHGIETSSLAYSLDGTTIVSGNYDNSASIWDAGTGRELATLTGHTGIVSSVAFNPAGNRIATGSYDKTIKVWDAKTKHVLLTLDDHDGHIYSVTYSPDGQHIASASHDRTVKIWNAKSGHLIRTLNSDTGAVVSVAFSPVDGLFASAGFDQTITIWNLETGAPLNSLHGHSARVNHIAFSPDGKRIVSCANDKTVRLWDTQTGVEVLAFRGNYFGNSVAFSPAGNRIALGGGEHATPVFGEIRVWDAPVDTENAVNADGQSILNQINKLPESKEQ